MADRPTLLVVGAAARDIDHSDPRGWRLGGTVAYASLAAARLGVHVRALVGVDDQTATADELEILRTAGVDLRTVPIDRGPVFDNRQTPAGRVQVAYQASDRIAAAALPDAWRMADAVLLGPVANELGDDWANVFPRSELVALAWQGLLRRLVQGQPVEPLPLTKTPLTVRADVILISAEDVLSGDTLLGDLLGFGQQLLLTHGEKGAASLIRGHGTWAGWAVPALPRRQPIDPTGAGDVFLAGWLVANLLAPGAGEVSRLGLGSVVAGLKVGKSGLPGTPTVQEVCQELARLTPTDDAPHDVSRSELESAIKTAFEGVRLGDGISLRHAEAIDDWYEGISESELQDRMSSEVIDDWTKVPEHELDSENLAHLDAEGLRYYLPAFMLRLLDHYDPMAMWCIGTIYALDQRRRHPSGFLELLNPEQRRVMAAYVRALPYLVELDHEDRVLIKRAFRDIWSRELAAGP